MLPRRRENIEEKQFSFSGPLMEMESSDEFETWAERIKSDYGYFGRASNVKVGAWAKRITYVNPDEGEFQGVLGRKEDEDVPSPTLWEKKKEGGGGERSPGTKSDEAYPMLGLTMRSQMMARYRKEMIDLVRDVPENAYELSLRDIVEIPIPRQVKTELEVKGEENKEKKKKEKKKGGRRMSRSESLDTGLLLRMFVPATMRRKSFGAAGGTCSKVSPKPMMADGGGGSMEKGPDGEWWKKKDVDELNSSSSSGSSSGGSTSTSSDSNSSSNNNKSNSSNTGRRKKSRCLPFLHFCKSKTRGD
ncbi:hypothetical protein J5N97_021120 [Dioscorea zingiberensis]|uniref:Uncharacterized protein n=1 Tax=Dioscorea zingiberensis TaxID=325984 RepID=A0A9D5CH17_9LILI|nr:hypothetical protein J5N97_021120 [Dioscorea zingiberensis]